MIRAWTLLALSTGLAACSGDKNGGVDSGTGTDTDTDDYGFWDAHTHDVASMSTDEQVALETEHGVTRLNLFRNRDEAVLLEAEADWPGVVYAWIDIPRDDDKYLVLDETTVPYLEGYLESGLAHGLGELCLRHYAFGASPEEGDMNPADGEVPLAIYDLAAAYNVPVTVHQEVEWVEEFENALAHNRDATIIWAHAGDADANQVLGVLTRNSNAMIDISCRNDVYTRWPDTADQRITDESGELKEGWRTIFETFPDRVLFGLDLGPADRVEQVPETMDYYKSVLDSLDPDIAAAIAEGNMERLMGL